MQICCAPNEFGLQCHIPTNRKFHCDNHFLKAHELYEKYKKICEIVKIYTLAKSESMLDVNEKIKYINKCYYIYKRAYDGRMKHRNYAFVPKYWDWGHDLQFIKLLNLIKKCEVYLEKVVRESLKKDQVEDVETDLQSTIVAENWENSQESHEIKNFKLMRRQDEEETNRIMKYYIDENKNLVLEKITCIDKLVKSLGSLGKYSEQELFILLKVIETLKKWQFFGNEEMKKKLEVLHKCQLPNSKFKCLTSWLDENMTVSDIIDYTNLIQMYFLKIKEIIQNWSQSLNKKMCVILSFGQKILLENKLKSHVEDKYFCLAKYKQTINPQVLIQRNQQLMKLGKKCICRKDTILLPYTKEIEI